MQGDHRGIVELSRRAAAAARTERAALVAAMRPPWVRNNYKGVHRRKDRYYAVIWNSQTARQVWLGSYATPEEAAYAYDAAARLTRGHRARPNFSAPEVASTGLVLALPTRRDPSAAVAAQLSFDNWLLAGSAAAAGPQQQQQQPTVVLPPFTQFFNLADRATAAAEEPNGGAAVLNPSNPGAYVSTPQNVQISPTSPASTALSSTGPEVDASQFFSAAAAAPTLHREPPVSQDGVSDLAVVEDNSWMFTVTNDGASSSAAPPRVSRLTFDLHLLQGGAQ